MSRCTVIATSHDGSLLKWKPFQLVAVKLAIQMIAKSANIMLATRSFCSSSLYDHALKIIAFRNSFTKKKERNVVFNCLFMKRGTKYCKHLLCAIAGVPFFFFFFVVQTSLAYLRKF